MFNLPKSVPDAFKKQFPRIVQDGDAKEMLVRWRMGKLRISLMPRVVDEGGGVLRPAILTIAHPKRYPEWDEIVWIRYSVLKGTNLEHSDFGMILPKLDEYINYTDGSYMQHTFTLEELLYRRES